MRPDLNAELHRAATGGIAGVLATVVMSAWMLLADYLGWMREQPPRTSTSRVARTARMPMSGARLDAATGLAHLGFGLVGGSVFGALSRRLPNMLTSMLVGIGYGLLIWATSYVAVLPSLNLMPGPAEGERGRTPVMVLAHVVYGAVLGVVAYGLHRHRAGPMSRRALDGARPARTLPP